MTSGFEHWVLPYTQVVGQESLKLALELSYIAPGIGGVLVSGQRGSAKSTTVRAFCLMTYGELPVTLPLNATDDRGVGGWKLNELMRARTRWQPGLLKKANGKEDYSGDVRLINYRYVT